MKPSDAALRGFPRSRFAASLALLTLLLVVSEPGRSQAQPDFPDDAPTVHPFSGLGDHLAGTFTHPRNWLLHGGAIAGTALMAFTVDRPIQDVFQEQNPLGQDFARGVLFVGDFSTLAASGGLYLSGLVVDDPEIINGGAAALQSVGITFALVTALKFITGRFGPPDGDADAEEDPGDDDGGGWWRNSEDPTDFQFNFFEERGFFWPSGHTSSHFALVSSLVAFYRADWMPWVLYPIAALVGVAMIDGDYHWASDVVAGALIGHAVGWTVGSGFRERSLDPSAAPEEDALRLWIEPQGTSTALFGVSGTF